MAVSKCEKVYNDVINMTVGSDDSLFQLAQCFISGFEIAELEAMLCSIDVGVVLDGLFICKEIGALVLSVDQSVLNLEGHYDNDVRQSAREVAQLFKLYTDNVGNLQE